MTKLLELDRPTNSDTIEDLTPKAQFRGSYVTVLLKAVTIFASLLLHTAVNSDPVRLTSWNIRVERCGLAFILLNADPEPGFL